MIGGQPSRGATLGGLAEPKDASLSRDAAFLYSGT